jgi:hypothetical protein
MRISLYNHTVTTRLDEFSCVTYTHSATKHTVDQETKKTLHDVLAFILLSDLNQETKAGLLVILTIILLSRNQADFICGFSLIVLPGLDQETQTGLLLVLALLLLSDLDQEINTGLLHRKKRFPTFPSPARMSLTFFTVCWFFHSSSFQV